jgi:hypothetical protein
MFQIAYRTKNVPEKFFIGENTVPDRPFITAKTKRFRKDYLSEQNIPERLLQQKCSGQTFYWRRMFRTDNISEQQILRIESCTQNSHRFISREACH